MKMKLKQRLCVLMCIALVVGMMPGMTFNVKAETTDEYVTVSTFDELSTAVANGGKIRLANDITVTSEIKIVSGKEIIIDGNDKKLTGGGSNRAFSVSGTLTLKDITLSGFSTRGGGAIVNNGTLVLDNCVFANNSSPFSGAGGGAIENSGKLYAANTVFPEIIQVNWEVLSIITVGIFI
ncbi:MAG: hypothetical protein K6G27_01460 [Lachnospiraceae bacterium]|nr:hypothetical protein [Lachnospiraceae bacterium]